MNYFMDRNTQDVDTVKAVGKKDILVGIPSFKNQETIAYVVEVVGKGLEKYFPDYSAVIMNSDGNSPDETRKRVEDACVPVGIDKVISIYSGISGKGSAFRNIFEVSRYLDVKGCVVVDSDLRSITPEWIRLLLEPILEGRLDYITPLYIRHKYDGTITNNFVYPLTRSLYGYDIRQPIGGDFGFSARLLNSYLNQDVWETSVAKYGIDIWMTTTALAEGFRVGQAALGAKIHDAKDPSIFLAPMFRQVVGTMFTMARRFDKKWMNVNKVLDTPLVGEPFDREPEPVAASYDPLVEKFEKGYKDFADFWKKHLATENYELLESVHKGVKDKSFNISNLQWAKLIFDFLILFNKNKEMEEEILDSLTPLYFIKIADFMNKADSKNTADSEEMIIEQAREFLRQKDYLVSRWEKEMLAREV
ncbi:MAG: hypothetical protein ACLFQV_02255 [Vulcanimicrobiota bacterium]